MVRERRHLEVPSNTSCNQLLLLTFFSLRPSRVRHKNYMPKLGPTHRSEKNAVEGLICITCIFCFFIWVLDVGFTPSSSSVFIIFFLFYGLWIEIWINRELRPHVRTSFTCLPAMFCITVIIFFRHYFCTMITAILCHQNYSGSVIFMVILTLPKNRILFAKKNVWYFWRKNNWSLNSLRRLPAWVDEMHSDIGMRDFVISLEYSFTHQQLYMH